MSKVHTIKSVDLGFGTLRELSNGIIIYDFKDDVSIDIADIKLMIEAHSKLANGIPRPVLVNTGKRMGISPEARAFDNIEDRKRITKAEALVIDNIATRIGANFYYMIQRPPYQVKTFPTQEKALKWLEKLL